MRRFVLLALVVIATACAPEAVAPEPSTSVPAPSTTTTTSTTIVEDSRPTLADAVVPLGSAIFDSSTASNPPAPVALSIDGVRVDSAPVIPVGVEENGEMEIPGAREVGWYRFGPTPSQDGSSVLAAHIAWNGRNGVFRNLATVAIGAIVTVEYEDGSLTRHVVTEVAQYAKDQLPFDRVFAKAGPRTLTLITCGGDFNRSLNSYADNIVVYAAPLD